MRVLLKAALLIALCGVCVSAARQQQRRPTARSGSTTSATEGAAERTRRSYDQWLEIIKQFARPLGSSAAGGAGAVGGLGGPWQPFPVDLPIGRDGKHTSLPVLILPIPVPVAGADRSGVSGACNANNANIDVSGRINLDRYSSNGNYALSGFEQESSGHAASSDYLLQLFREQQATAPELPPALIGVAPRLLPPQPDRGYLPPSRSAFLPPQGGNYPPPTPRFDRSMLLHGYLMVDRADYTEVYTSWYDARSGSARVDYHEGGATSYRTMSADGRVRRVMRSVDRTGERDVRVCGVSPPVDVGPQDRAPPALPDPSEFSFAGYRDFSGMQAEVWTRNVTGRAGELGGARGEALTYSHELLVHRRDDGFTVPLTYMVTVDSTVLGPRCDRYQHVYSEVREQEHDPNIFNFDVERECDDRELMDPREPHQMAHLEPLLEFTLPRRDPRYDLAFESYTKEYERTYVDDKEAAMRKNLLMQQTRFVASGNRESGTFVLEVNYLSDRLNAEIEILLGVAFSSTDEFNVYSKFPITVDRIQSATADLPKEFDWRPKGAVTPVKFQGTSCSSCWAFAVVASVEGALFVQTGRLRELSEQTLVDCAHSHKANGCNGTWPVHAFNYIKDRGLPARDEYTPYQAKVLQCRAPPVPPVTHIEGGVDVPPENIDALKLAIRNYAPTVVVVDGRTRSFISYKRGVLRDDRCVKSPKKRLNHAVVAVGWGEHRGDPHFIIKNSWHAKWGDGGYIRLHAPTNTCGHLTTPQYAQLRQQDVDDRSLLSGGGGGAAGRGGDVYRS